MNSTPTKQSPWQELNRPEVSLLDENPRREKRSALLGKIAEYMTVSMFVLTVISYEWAHWYFKWTPHPLIFGVVGGALVAYALLRVGLLLPRLRALKKESQAAGQYRQSLRQLAAHGWYVFRDVRDARGFVVGNVVAGPGGLFALTARYLSRSGTEFESIEVSRNETISINGHIPIGQPVLQARHAAAALYSILAGAGLDTVEVRPVVVFPLWRIKGRENDEETQETEVWALNEIELVEKLTALPPVLEPKTVIELCTLLEKHAIV